MTMFRRSRRTVPMLNTAALPDLIFTVLFFFITVTHMRQVTPEGEIQSAGGNRTY